MPLLTDLNAVRTLLNSDRNWSAYAIGDLGAGLIEQCEWHAPANGASALLLLYRGFDPPITFAIGDPRHLEALFAELNAPRISLHLRPDAIEAMAVAYRPRHTKRMQRMALRPELFTPVEHHDVVAIGEPDLAAVIALYDDGHQRGERPDFFFPDMLQQKTFHGVWENGALIALAGTHLYSPELGVCTIGNVYTRSDRRGRGLAARVTSAVATKAIADGVATIVLNVGDGNTTAQRVYTRLGFRPYCEFFEGEAVRVS